ncbi:MAG: hypothetical protein JF614_23645 [Acidobacteria bacterium]|nr:hypothetical protein [Acidobacteriota bacterium]
MRKSSKVRLMFLAACLACLPLVGSTTARAAACIPAGGIDDTLYRTDCCSGRAVPGSTYCTNPADWYTTWESCTQVCAQ